MTGMPELCNFFACKEAQHADRLLNNAHKGWVQSSSMTFVSGPRHFYERCDERCCGDMRRLTEVNPVATQSESQKINIPGHLCPGLGCLYGTSGSAYGIRLGLFAGMRRCPPRASFLVSLFTAYHRFTPIFVGVAVRIAVQPQAPGTPSWLCPVRPGVALVIDIVLDHPPDVPLSPAHVLLFLAFPFPFEPALHPKARAKASRLALKGDLIDRLLPFLRVVLALLPDRQGDAASCSTADLHGGQPFVAAARVVAVGSAPGRVGFAPVAVVSSSSFASQNPRRVALKRLLVLLSEDTYRHPSLAFCCPSSRSSSGGHKRAVNYSGEAERERPLPGWSKA